MDECGCYLCCDTWSDSYYRGAGTTTEDNFAITNAGSKLAQCNNVQLLIAIIEVLAQLQRITVSLLMLAVS